MTPRAAVVSAAATATSAGVIAALAFGPSEGWTLLPLAVSLVAVGALLTLKRHGNPIGPLLLAWSVICGYSTFVETWGNHAAAAHRIGSVLPWAAELVIIVWHPGFWLFVMICLVFPDGQFLSIRWRRLAAVITAWYAALAVSSVFASDNVSSYAPGIPPPYILPGRSIADVIFGVLLGTQLGWLVVGAGALVVRWRRTSGDDRRQVTVFVFPTALALVLFVVKVEITGNGAYAVLLFAVLPITIGIAVLRYKLYAIDRVVSRTVSYGVITAIVAVVYVGAIQLVGLAVPRSDSVAIAVATLAGAAIFNPVRRRVQRFVDRRFNRERYDRERLVVAFRASLRQPELTQTEAALIDVVAAALQPRSCSVWVVSGQNSMRPDRSWNSPVGPSGARVASATVASVPSVTV